MRDWSHPVIDKPISQLSDPADWFIIDAIVVYRRAESTPTVRPDPSRSLKHVACLVSFNLLQSD